MCDFFFFSAHSPNRKMSLSTNIKGTSTQNALHILKMNKNVSDFHSAASGRVRQLYNPVLFLLLGLRFHINVPIISIYKNTARPACYVNNDRLHSFLFSQYYKILIFSVFCRKTTVQMYFLLPTKRLYFALEMLQMFWKTMPGNSASASDSWVDNMS